MAGMDLDQFEDNMVVEWADKYMRYADLLECVGRLTNRPDHYGDISIDRMDEAADTLLGQDREAFQRLLREGELVVTAFFIEQEEVLLRRKEDLEIYRQTDGHDDATLKKALVELYRAFLLLQNYATLNFTAAFEAMKAMDQATGRRRSAWFQIREQVVDHSYYQRAQELDVHLLGIQQVYAVLYTDGDAVLAKQLLTERMHTPARKYSDVFSLGFFGGFSMPLIVLLISLVSVPASDDFDPLDLYATLPVWRATGVIILTIWLWGVCVSFYERFRVNYSFIMDLTPSKMIDFHNLFKTATLLTALWLATFACFIASLRRDIDIFPINRRWYPFTLVLTLTAIFLCPFNIVHRSSRWWLIKRMVHVFVSPFVAVTFADNLIGDYFTSLVKVLYDIEFVACFYFTGDWWHSDYDRCQQQNKNIALPILVGLPLFWRLMQCLRRVYDTGDKWPHLANAGKYSVALLGAVIGVFHSEWKSSSNPEWDFARVAYIGLLTIATLYAYTWDITMDWSLVWWSGGHLHFRQKFIYGNKYLYIVPAIVNVVGRVVWALTLVIQPVHTILNPELLTFILTAVEIIRRSVWAIIRLENEHSNNCGRYRAVKDIPLRFHDVQIEKDDLKRVEEFVDRRAINGVQVDAASSNESRGSRDGSTIN